METRADAVEKILIDDAKTVTVERKNQIVRINIPESLTQKILAAGESNLIDIRYPFVVGEVSHGSPAEKAKLIAGDSIIAVNGKEMNIFQDISAELSASKNSLITVTYVRNGITENTEVQINEDGKLGVYMKPPSNYVQSKKQEYGFFQSIPAGINMGVETLSSYIKQFKLVFTKEGAKSLGGFGSIGQLFPGAWDWQAFWLMTAFLSVILAFMNFLPIPGLDGGYVLFLVYEMITGRKPSDKFLEYAQTVGMVLLLLLLIYANGNDIFKAFFK